MRIKNFTITFLYVNNFKESIYAIIKKYIHNLMSGKKMFPSTATYKTWEKRKSSFLQNYIGNK